MKLKKIASLMLAGVMAVSMLAGCNTASNGNGSDGEGEGEGEGTVVSGYSATLKDALKGDVKDMDNVTFQDNASYAAALQKALNNVTDVSVKWIAEDSKTVVNAQTYKNGDCQKMRAELAEALKITDGNFDVADLEMNWYANGTNNTFTNRKVTEGALFAVNGTVGTDEAIKQVAGQVNEYLNKLPENGKDNSSMTTWDYDYVVSVSVVNKALEPFAGYTTSATFIAVTVDRTVTNG